MKEFPDDGACLTFLWRQRYSSDGIHAHCPKCKTEREFKRYEHSQQRQAWTCQACGKHLAPTAGTIFHKSSTSLHLWFLKAHRPKYRDRLNINVEQLQSEIEEAIEQLRANPDLLAQSQFPTERLALKQ